MSLKSHSKPANIIALAMFVLCLVGFHPALSQETVCQNDAFVDTQLPLIQNIEKTLSLSKSAFAACKRSPQDKGELLVVLLSRSVEKIAECDGCALYDLIFATTDATGEATKVRYQRKSAFLSDALEIDNISLDTGLYRLADGIRALGFRLERRTHSASGYQRSELFLYVRNQESLTPIFRSTGQDETGSLNGLVINSRVAEVGFNNCIDDSISEMTSTIDFGAVHQKFRDIVVRAKTVTRNGVLNGEACEHEISSTSLSETTYTYNGRYYRID